jgi:[ribosomal protein S18]-alanine N-acetyltransferase
MLVRPALADEADEIARQYARMAEEGWIAGEPPIDLAERAQRFRTSIEDGTTFVLEIDGQLVGHGGLSVTHAKGVMTFGMAVMPEARGTGGGRALLNRIVEYAREQGCHKVELEVWVDNARAISLYATSGFEVEGLKRDHYRRKDGSLRSALLMARML